MFRYLAVCMAASVGFAGGFRERWVIDEGQKALWEETLGRAGVSAAYVEEVLARYKLVSLEFGRIAAIREEALPPLRADVPERLVWQDGTVSVYTARNPRVRHHLWVVLNRPVENFGAVSVDEALAMRAAANKIIRILREKCALPAAVVAQGNEALAGRFAMEIIPPRAETKRVHNICDKVECNNHVLFAGEFPEYLPAPGRDVADEDAAFWKEALVEDGGEPFLDGAPEIEESWTQVQVHRIRAGEELVDFLYQSLKRRGLRIERIGQPYEPSAPDSISVEIGQCAFCNERVVQMQKVFETARAVMLFNYKPALKGAHFLIVPKRHVRSSDRLTKEETEEMHRLAQKAVKAFEKVFGRKDAKMYFQDGPSVGQTVAHAHMHVMLPPDPIRYHLFSLNYEKERTYKREELEPSISEICYLLSSD